MNYRTGYEFEMIARHQAGLRDEVNRNKLAVQTGEINKSSYISNLRRWLGKRLIVVGEQLVLAAEQPGASY